MVSHLPNSHELVHACVAGVHNEGAGREIQAAGSPGGSHAEGVEVSPTTEGGTPCCE